MTVHNFFIDKAAVLFNALCKLQKNILSIKIAVYNIYTQDFLYVYVNTTACHGLYSLPRSIIVVITKECIKKIARHSTMNLPKPSAGFPPARDGRSVPSTSGAWSKTSVFPPSNPSISLDAKTRALTANLSEMALSPEPRPLKIRRRNAITILDQLPQNGNFSAQVLSLNFS